MVCFSVLLVYQWDTEKKITLYIEKILNVTIKPDFGFLDFN